MATEKKSPDTAASSARNTAPGTAAPDPHFAPVSPESTPPGAVPSRLRPIVDAITPDALAAVRQSVETWPEIADRLGVADHVEVDDSDDRAVLAAFCMLPDPVRHEMAREYPVEMFGCLGTILSALELSAPHEIEATATDFLGPDVATAFFWQFENSHAAMFAASGHGNLIN